MENQEVQELPKKSPLYVFKKKEVSICMIIILAPFFPISFGATLVLFYRKLWKYPMSIYLMLASVCNCNFVYWAEKDL